MEEIIVASYDPVRDGADFAHLTEMSSPETGWAVRVARLEGHAAGILVLRRHSRLGAEPYIYVKPVYRRRGIGSALQREADRLMAGSSYAFAACEMAEDAVTDAFLTKHGYIRDFTGLRMERESVPVYSPAQETDALSARGLAIRGYRDADYTAYHSISDVAFYLMREQACVLRWYNPPSQRDREILSRPAVAASRYVLTENGIAIALCRIVGNNIALLGVRPDKQGQGYGRLLLRWCINRIAREEATDRITISVLEKNPARYLYESEGFRETGRYACYYKFHRPDPRPAGPEGYPDTDSIREAFRREGMLRETVREE